MIEIKGMLRTLIKCRENKNKQENPVSKHGRGEILAGVQAAFIGRTRP